MQVDDEHVKTIAQIVTTAVLDAEEKRRKVDRRRYVGFDAIRDAIRDLAGVRPCQATVQRWVEKNRFPMDKLKGSKEVSVTHSNLLRWIEANHQPVKD